jgi:DNA polymerase-1
MGYSGFRHYYGQVSPDTSFPKDFKFYLVNTKERLKAMADRYLETCKNKIIAFDTETNSLSPLTTISGNPTKIVGYSLAFTPKEGFYIPLHHDVGKNCPRKLACKVLNRIMEDATLTCMYNGKFDMNMAEHHLETDLEKIRPFDVQAMVWILDTNKRMPSLKWSATHFLGWRMLKYIEALTGTTYATIGQKDLVEIDSSEQNLASINPKLTTEYAATDAMATLALFLKIRHLLKNTPAPSDWKNLSKVLEIDNNLLLPLLRMEQQGIRLDKQILKELYNKLPVKIRNIEMKVYNFFGEAFNIGSPSQLGRVLTKAGIDTGVVTKSGSMATGKDALPRVADKYPEIKLILEYRSLLKMGNTYLKNLINSKSTRFAYSMYVAPTGRLSGGGSDNNPYFCPVNIQAITKAKTCMYRCEKSNKEGNILGYSFIKDEKGSIEGFDQEESMRSAFLPDKGHYFVHIDYSAQELRIPANMSKDPFLVHAFQNNLDLHYEMSKELFGVSNARKMRHIAKTMNFLSLYGGSKHALAPKIGVDLDTAEVYLKQWWSRLGVLNQWKLNTIRYGRTHGSVYTAFGRPRRVKHDLNSSDFRKKSFGERTAVNTRVQGTGADIIKVVMSDIYRQVLKKYSSDDVKMIIQVHDELNFSITKDPELFSEIVTEILKIMDIKVKGWCVPMDVDIAVGDSWGNYFSFEFDKEYKLQKPA